MSVVVLESGAFSIVAKYIFQKSGSAVWYFRRRIPDDVRKHYPGKKNGYLIFSLGTKDQLEAAKKAHQKALEQEAMWKSIRDGNVAAGPEVVSAAKEMLSSYGLKPGQYAEYEAADLEPGEFVNELHHQVGITGSHNQYKNWHKDLPPVHRMAGDLFYGGKEPVFLSVALKEFQELKGEDPKDRAGKDRVRVVNEFITQFGDLPIEKYSRDDANSFVKALLEKGNKTTTVQRRINSIRPVFSFTSRERELTDKRIFESLSIPKLGEDTKARLPFERSEIALIQAACIAEDDDIRWVVALLSDTGMRLGEATGLMTADVYLDDPIPYVSIRPNSARRLKSNSSVRDVPLVGASLWALRRAMPYAKNGFVFPRYIDATKDPVLHKGTSASNALKKWLRSQPITQSDMKTNHSFRHSAQDRLREVQTPQDIRNAICGWTNKGIGEGYGRGFSLGVLAQHLEKIVLPETMRLIQGEE
ncbi:tyrosine-type recombinase/integrase [Tropicibacter sp. R16_0]|uniref:DUF6538 domain-containing protein n=1 Tax=Tropicibacter sp. R16_0 TaxID=2821102 RepID=UPI001ADCC31F|nr:DUF6538 domain-containing protein [Tropicibacter sp. R16_0]MBO9449898.1 tyrosine-type recombinase/integrase [Tropicibacter sp. R16_0]